MNTEVVSVADAMSRQFFAEYPFDAARELEVLNVRSAVAAAAKLPANILTPVWQYLMPDRAAVLLNKLPESLINEILEKLSLPQAVRILGCMSIDDQRERIARLQPAVREDIESMMSYPPDTAGRLMDVSVVTYRGNMTVAQALAKLRDTGMKTARSLFLVDNDHRLTGKVALQELALASAQATLSELAEPPRAVLRPIDSLQEVTAAFDQHRVLDIPIVDLDGLFLGAVTHDRITQTVQQQSSVDIQTMVGASKDERALSNPLFTVRKRMPWLQINLVTAFLAASVVGLFENTIAQVTALAVLLPVVAGQSGNAGAQALAVTMRGLALREITVRQWLRVMRKEVMAGFLNGVGVALTCGIGVYFWSGSIALVSVIAASMVLAMVAAGFAGALIPILLTRLGQDPATSSSILLTTVTDVAGFFSFLGIATLFMRFL
jgi:magnesium transporter